MNVRNLPGPFAAQQMYECEYSLVYINNVASTTD